MIKQFLYNKQPKDPRLCKILRRAITLDRKRNGFEWEDIANELGLSSGTLENKLKPSYESSDITLSEFMHFMEMSGDYTALEYIANNFDKILISKQEPAAEVKTIDINLLVDMANIDNSEVFKEVKVDIEDKIIDKEEKKRILEAITKAQRSNAELRQRVLNINFDDE